MPLIAAATIANPMSLIAALGLGALGVFLLLPKPKRRPLAIGTFASLAGLIVLAVWLMNRFGPVANDTVGAILFWLFSGVAVLFSGVFVTQRNPARGAIAFAFVIVSVCGLFLLLAAPFLMAATIIIYAGAIIVTFLFVLMLSQTRLASDENDRTREPLLGSLAGFSFLGLILFALYTSSPMANAKSHLPVQPMTPAERATLIDVAAKLKNADDNVDLQKLINETRDRLGTIFGAPDLPISETLLPERLSTIRDPQTTALLKESQKLRNSTVKLLTDAEDGLSKSKSESLKSLSTLSDEILLFAAHGELPARNVANMGYVLYSDYILAVELAGTVLLVATIGAVLIASRKEAA